jgi:pyruvate kinase
MRRNFRALAGSEHGALHQRRTKIVCTLGPSSSTESAIRGLIDEGLDVARINFSHGTLQQHHERILIVRSIAAELGKPIAILGDLQGPRIRLGDLPATLPVVEGDDVVLVPEAVAAGGEIPVTYEALASDVREGDRILVDDGLIELLVIDVDEPKVTARVIHGGPLRSHKGLNLPGVDVSAPSVTEKDLVDIKFAIEHELDYLALSFVRRADDIDQVRALLPKRMLIIAKIEKDVALQNIDGIVRASDGIMVARGDLGVELPFETVPTAQKSIIALCNRLSRPVITATQMLESMVEHPSPTRAEASDVAIQELYSRIVNVAKNKFQNMGHDSRLPK